VTAAFVPISVLIALMSAPAGRWADRFGPGPLLAAGSALVALAYGGLAYFAEGGDFWGRIIPLMALGGVGLGLVVAPLTAAVMADSGDDEQGTASGINNAIARVAGLIAVALMGRLAAWAYGTPDAATLPGFGLPGTAAVHVVATGHAFAIVAGVASAMALLAAILSLTIRRVKAEP
jgi:MFS family permease